MTNVRDIKLPDLGKMAAVYQPVDAAAINWQEASPELAEQRLADRGFMIIGNVPQPDTSDENFGTEVCLSIAQRLGISTNDPVTPKQYVGDEAASMYRAAANLISPVESPDHGTFDSNRKQEVHTDGTHESIGKIGNSLLYCHRPAKQGGANRIYNLAAGFYDLAAIDQEAAYSLMLPEAFGRYSPGKPGTTYGPMFTQSPTGEVIGRYSEDFIDYDRSNPKLVKAVGLIRKLIRKPGRVAKVQLQAGEALVFDNNRIAHDREGFSFEREAPREIYRLLLSN
ncbi:MAG: TauD/TfdA family dioxygenase [Patescibacteria group bacterium]